MLRNYQIKPVNRAFEILKRNRLVYLNAEMRTGKTTMALTLANKLGCKSVLFVTPKKVVIDKIVERDYNREGFNFLLKVTNYEQIKKLQPEYDLIIADEAARFGQFPKPAIRTKNLKEIVGNNYLILMSGTPYPESMSQLFHQFWLSGNSPFPEVNFYKWAYKYVDIREKVFKSLKIKDYSKAIEDKILEVCGNLFVKVSQQEAGFKIIELNDKIIEIQIDNRIQKMVDVLLKDRFYVLKNGDKIVCDTPASLQCKIHQLFSGTVKTENCSYILDNSKANFIKQNYNSEKIVIFYKYIAEGEILRKTFAGKFSDVPSDFNLGLKRIFLSQIQSGSLGIDLSAADVIIFYNIDFSYERYAQAKARLQNLNRTKEAQIHWLFAKGGIEYKIYKVLMKKRDYSLYYFKKDFLTKIP